jgi:hypothetical protein
VWPRSERGFLGLHGCKVPVPAHRKSELRRVLKLIYYLVNNARFSKALQNRINNIQKGHPLKSGVVRPSRGLPVSSPPATGYRPPSELLPHRLSLREQIQIIRPASLRVRPP